MFVDTNAIKEPFTFIASAAMMPGDIRFAYPRASFVARGWLDVRPDAVNAYFQDAVLDRVWGLVLAGAEPVSERGTVTVTTDEGKEYTTILPEVPLLSGDPEEVLASARYWELPPSFITQLRRALEDNGLSVVDEEPRDDGNLG
ncbi:hypothetical protein BH23CHL5_BH23CHL5_11900 [soil metagenome]